MTYLADEIAGVDAIEAYLFTYGSQVWRFVDGDADFTHPVTMDVYVPEYGLERSNLQQSESDNAMSVDVSMDARCPIADFFRAPYLSAQHISLVIYRTHRGAAYAPVEIFSGTVGQCVFDGAKAALSCVPLRHTIGRQIPIQLVQAGCTNTVYDDRCKVDPATKVIAGTIVSIVGLLFTVTLATAKISDYFSGGFIQNGATPPASIEKHINIGGFACTLKMMYNPGYSAGDTINVYPGCSGQLSMCMTKFDNAHHFQGFPEMPSIDPFKDQIL